MFSTYSKQREIVCWTFAFALHCLLFFWQAVPFTLLDSDPIISIDFIVEEFKPAGLGQAKKGPVGGGKGLLGRIKKLLGFSQEGMQQKTSADKLSTGDLSSKIESKAPLKELKNDKLVDKKRTKAAKVFQVSPISTSSDDLADTKTSKINVESSKKASFKEPKKLADKQYSVSSSDLPFEIARAPKGELATGGGYDQAPVIATGKKTDKGVFSVSKNVVEDKGSYSGTGGGSGSLSGTGSFSGIAPVSGRSGGSESGGLSGAGAEEGTGIQTQGGGGSGRSWGGSSSGFSGAGSGSGGGAGGDEIGEGSSLAYGSGSGTGTGKGSGSGGDGLYDITGPLSGREILRKVIPPYPKWAQKKGIIASVSLRFWVLHDGIVKDNIVIVRTSGYPKLDKTAMDSLIKWKFVALPKSQYGEEQWGIITFKFKVR